MVLNLLIILFFIGIFGWLGYSLYKMPEFPDDYDWEDEDNCL